MDARVPVEDTIGIMVPGLDVDSGISVELALTVAEELDEIIPVGDAAVDSGARV